MPPWRGSCRTRLRMQSISRDATPSTLSDVTCVISFSASYGDAVISWTPTEMAARQDRDASAQLLRCCCKRRHIRDSEIAVALASASNDVGLTEGGSTLLLDRPCHRIRAGVCVLSLTTAGCYAVPGTLLLHKQHLDCTSSGIQISVNPMHTWAHSHGRCAARPQNPERGHA
eukprot:350266-Chlamydomonas_euryale.AAC.2